MRTGFYNNNYKTFFSVLKISKTFVFFLRTSGEYLTRFGRGSVFKIRFQRYVVKTDPCPYLIKYSPDVLKEKTKVLDNINMDKKCFIKFNVESSPQEIWISPHHWIFSVQLYVLA